MSLVTQLSRDFDSGVRNRGRSYFQGGLVRNLEGTAWSVEANVRGSRNYKVSLAREENEIKVSCTCPYFETAGPCKHIWATLLASDANGYLRGSGDHGPVHLVEDG